MPLSADDLTGYTACLVSSFMFGSNFVPVKRVYTGDGMFFTLMMTAAVFYEGCFIQLWQGNPKFEPVAMLGGALWATGNITVVPIVKTIGLGIGLLVWGLVSMLVGWASGHFGIFGVEPDPPLGAPWLNYLGVALATASLGVYAKIKSQVAEGSGSSSGPPRGGTGPASARPSSRSRRRSSRTTEKGGEGKIRPTFPVCPTFPWTRRPTSGEARGRGDALKPPSVKRRLRLRPMTAPGTGSRSVSRCRSSPGASTASTLTRPSTSSTRPGARRPTRSTAASRWTTSSRTFAAYSSRRWCTLGCTVSSSGPRGRGPRCQTAWPPRWCRA